MPVSVRDNLDALLDERLKGYLHRLQSSPHWTDDDSLHIID